MTHPLTERLKKLDAESTQGDWDAFDSINRWTVEHYNDGAPKILAETPNAFDALFIAESRNALPKLLKAIEIATEAMEAAAARMYIEDTTSERLCEQLKNALTQIKELLK